MFQVYLGDPHQCSCHEFRKSHDLCLHLCWVLLRKLKLQPDDPLAYQGPEVERKSSRNRSDGEEKLGMVPQELSRLLYSKDKHCESIRKRAQRDVTNETLGEVTSRKITKEDVCPICLENLLEKKSPVTHCRYGCGQAVHIHCMKVMARHQMDGMLEKNIGHTMLFCPLCRGDFTTWQSLQQEERNAPSKKRTLLNSIRRHSSNQKLQEFSNTTPSKILHELSTIEHVMQSSARTVGFSSVVLHGL
uniref:SWIM-type domain-containing protein n=1 Tax=Timema poppense TaxID=170557 RepID=A0A7R9DK53_TIMPO|nr:unnamed protein product [Timema poppensis]